MELNEFRRRVVSGTFTQYRSLADAIRQMKFVQADPIRSPARAQDLILRHRVEDYLAGQLEDEFPNLEAEEGYLFAYGFMTPDIWQRLGRKKVGRLSKLELAVLKAVGEVKDLHPRDLEKQFGRKSVTNAWGGTSRQTKRILEKLHALGRLRVSRRENGLRVYQLPRDSSTMIGSSSDRYRYLAMETAKVFGPTTKSFLISELRSQNHLLPSRLDRVATLDSLIDSGLLSEVVVDGVNYLWEGESWSDDTIEDRVRILAPFDPLIRDRERFEKLWGWSYRFEAYVPASKRERGYYAMPVLWRDEVIGWANANVIDRTLEVEVGYATRQPRSRAFRQGIEAEAQAMAQFLKLDYFAIDHR
ncbi:MAG: crosslink repair DNA glycosylase YcaQ family protein [Planctomycetota bacterium]